MRLTTVGTGTVAPHAQRVCAGHLVEAGDVVLLLDCGSGVVHRLAALALPWTRITHIAITHFHADHIADLAMLCYAFRYGQLPARSAALQIIGPPGIRDLVDRLALVFGAWLHAPGYPVEVVECTPADALRLGSTLTLTCFPVPHTAESVAYSMVDGTRRVVYSGDTGFSEPLARWAAACDVLLAECSLPDALAIPSHCTPTQVGTMAAMAQPSLLALTHFYPPVEAVDIAALVAAQFSGSVVLATDGWSIDL
jgi:ribonuclease BN (tRNA processing enzyme)